MATTTHFNLEEDDDVFDDDLAPEDIPGTYLQTLENYFNRQNV